MSSGIPVPLGGASAADAFREAEKLCKGNPFFVTLQIFRQLFLLFSSGRGRRAFALALSFAPAGPARLAEARLLPESECKGSAFHFTGQIFLGLFL